jgi:Holliday junction resolvase-like predicted endonuclease
MPPVLTRRGRGVAGIAWTALRTRASTAHTGAPLALSRDALRIFWSTAGQYLASAQKVHDEAC